MNLARKNRVSQWAYLVMGFLCIWLFIFIVAPWVQQLPSVSVVHQYIEENNIDATPLFYTEAEEFARAELHMWDVKQFTPR